MSLLPSILSDISGAHRLGNGCSQPVFFYELRVSFLE